MSQNPEIASGLPEVEEFYSHRVMAFMLRSRNSAFRVPVLRRTVAVGNELEGLWEFPGGKQDSPDESPEETVLREYPEEMGEDKSLTLVSERPYELPMRYFVNSKGIGKIIMPTIQYGVTDQVAIRPVGDQHDRLRYVRPAFIVNRPRNFTPDTVNGAKAWFSQSEQLRFV